MKSSINFIKAFLKNPSKVGAITQSQYFLAKELISSVDFNSAKCIIEFGAGTGPVTKKILEKMSKRCTLLCFEIDPLLTKQLRRKFNDSRLKIIQDSAENISKYLQKYGFKKADYIISGLPLAIMPKNITKDVLNKILYYLKEGGKYTQLQYSLVSLKKIKKFFPCLSISFIAINIPPAFVYVCIK